MLFALFTLVCFVSGLTLILWVALTQLERRFPDPLAWPVARLLLLPFARTLLLLCRAGGWLMHLTVAMPFSPTGPRDRTLRRTCGYCGYGWRHYAHCPLGNVRLRDVARHPVLAMRAGVRWVTTRPALMDRLYRLGDVLESLPTRWHYPAMALGLVCNRHFEQAPGWWEFEIDCAGHDCRVCFTCVPERIDPLSPLPFNVDDARR